MVYIITVMMLVSLTSPRKTVSLSSHHGVNGGLGEVHMFQATWKQFMFVSALRTSRTSLACHNRHEFTRVCVNSGCQLRKNCRLCIYINPESSSHFWNVGTEALVLVKSSSLPVIHEYIFMRNSIILPHEPSRIDIKLIKITSVKKRVQVQKPSYAKGCMGE